MRGRAGYIHEYAKDLGISDDEAVYPSFYLRHFRPNPDPTDLTVLELLQFSKPDGNVIKDLIELESSTRILYV